MNRKNISVIDKPLLTGDKDFDFLLSCLPFEHQNQTINLSWSCPAWLWNSSFWTVSVKEDNLLPIPLTHRTVVIFMVLYLIIISLAVLGNSCVLLIIGCIKRIKTVTDMYIISLAASDFMIATLNMPFQLYFIVANEWPTGGDAGLFLCKFSNFIQGVSVVASILTLLFIALDRYLVICSTSLAHKYHKQRTAAIIIVLVWGLSIAALSPHLFFQNLDKRIKIEESDGKLVMKGFGYLCAEFYPNEYFSKIYSALMYVLVYLVPIFIMAYSYAKIGHRLWIIKPIGIDSGSSRSHFRIIQRKKRIIKMLLLVVLAFTVLWLPYFTFSLYREFASATDQNFRMRSAILKLIGYSNCCVNPIIYTFLSRTFQNEFIKMCCKNRVIVTSSNYKTDSMKNSKKEGTRETKF
ncbi:hypothetical protein FSP39_004796 [Pinctada imbricata]|uniref:G-protein coupled receptors family 1 profile domain-containing protein n=1 Tax=Pinctada imbricata TaxID=66713 RepID=A0AA88Y4W4_PINIB|nr:hypothetical protein FSP39_004796 [Pinctada imbricata]